MDELLSASAVTPIWLRLFALWCLTGLALYVYQLRREAGDETPKALGQVFLFAVVPPYTAIVLLVKKIRANLEEVDDE